jgi:hypothetical protein
MMAHLFLPEMDEHTPQLPGFDHQVGASPSIGQIIELPITIALDYIRPIFLQAFAGNTAVVFTEVMERQRYIILS